MHVALLRGVNVGGHNRLPMRDLAEMFRDAGCVDVRTYIQSGNVVFTAGAAVARSVPGIVEPAIARRFGFEVPMVTRTIAELREVATGNPFLSAGEDPDTLHVAFLRDRPSKARAAALDPRYSPPDEFVARDREIYLHCPDGIGRSRLTAAYFDAQLKTISTTRNWRTVVALLELAGGSGLPREILRST